MNIQKQTKSCTTPVRSFSPPLGKGKKVWRGERRRSRRREYRSEEGDEAGGPALTPQRAANAPSVPAPRLARPESVLPPALGVPTPLPRRALGSCISSGPLRAGRPQISPRREGGNRFVLLSQAGRTFCVPGAQRGRELAGAGAPRTRRPLRRASPAAAVPSPTPAPPPLAEFEVEFK